MFDKKETDFKQCQVSLGPYSDKGIWGIGDAFIKFWNAEREEKGFKDSKQRFWEGCVTWSGDTPQAIHDLEKEEFEQSLRYKKTKYGSEREFANEQFDLFDIHQILKTKDKFALMRCKSGIWFPSWWNVKKIYDKYYFEGNLRRELMGNMVEKLTAIHNRNLWKKDDDGNLIWIEPENGIVQCSDEKIKTFIYQDGLLQKDIELLDLLQ